MDRKILLINPPYSFNELPSPPFGLMSLAAYLQEKGFSVKIADFVVTPYRRKKIQAIIDEFKPQITGATAVTMTVNSALSILKDVKQTAPNIITVLGGPHATFDAEELLIKNFHLDFIVRGEGELTAEELFTAITSGEDYSHIAGISFSEQSRIRHNPEREFIQDINILPFPARDLVEQSKYNAAGLPSGMITSRGCPHKCIFCVGSKMVGRKVRYFDIQRVADEFQNLSSLTPLQINIVDDLFTSNVKRCISFCEEIVRRKIVHPWSAFARVDTVQDDLLEALKAAGCITLCFGIESGNQEILDNVKKKTTLEKCRRAVSFCKKHGITAMTSYILGLPGETPQTIEETLQFSRKLSPNYGYHILAPFPGTEVREKADEYGIKILTDDWNAYDANRPVCHPESIPPEEINSKVKQVNDYIESYIETAMKSYLDGDIIDENDYLFAQKHFRRTFVVRLLSEEIIDGYSGQESSRPIEGLVEHIENKTGYGKEIITQEIEQLLSEGCLEIVKGNCIYKFQWAKKTGGLPPG